MHLSFKMGGSMKKKCNIDYIGRLYLFSNINICGLVIAYLVNITNLEILPYLLHFSEVLKRMLIIKYFVG